MGAKLSLSLMMAKADEAAGVQENELVRIQSMIGAIKLLN